MRRVDEKRIESMILRANHGDSEARTRALNDGVGIMY